MNDAGTLEKVAAKLAEGKASSARSAIVQSLDKPDEANVRRLQRKWREAGEALLAAAREALRQRQQDSDRRAREVVGDGYAGSAFTSMDAATLRCEALMAAARLRDGCAAVSAAAVADRAVEEVMLRERALSVARSLGCYEGLGVAAMAEREAARAAAMEQTAAMLRREVEMAETLRQQMEMARGVGTIGDNLLERYAVGVYTRRPWE